MKINHGFTTNNNKKNPVNVVEPWSPQINHGFATLTIV